MTIDLMCSAQMTSLNGSRIPKRRSDRVANCLSMPVSPPLLPSKLQTSGHEHACHTPSPAHDRTVRQFCDGDDKSRVRHGPAGSCAETSRHGGDKLLAPGRGLLYTGGMKTHFFAVIAALF